MACLTGPPVEMALESPCVEAGAAVDATQRTSRAPSRDLVRASDESLGVARAQSLGVARAQSLEDCFLFTIPLARVFSLRNLTSS